MRSRSWIGLLLLLLALVCAGVFSLASCERVDDDEGSAVLCEYICVSLGDGTNACDFYCEDPDIEFACNYCDYKVESGVVDVHCTECDVTTY